MTTRAEQAARTRDQLIEAGLSLVDRVGLAGLSVNLVVEEAGVAKGTFFHHFGDRAGYLLALHRGLHDQLFAEIITAAAKFPDAREALIASANLYLDKCLQRRGVRALLLEARAEPVIASEAAERTKTTSSFISPAFAALGWPDPIAGATLWYGLVCEAALTELDAGGRQPQIRAALERFLPPRESL